MHDIEGKGGGREGGEAGSKSKGLREGKLWKGGREQIAEGRKERSKKRWKKKSEKERVSA